MNYKFKLTVLNTMKSILNKKSVLLFATLTFIVFFVLNISIKSSNNVNNEGKKISNQGEVSKVDLSNQCVKEISIGFNTVFAQGDPGSDDGEQSPCDAIACLSSSACGVGDCPWREVCDGCGCTFEQVADYQGSSRCGD